MTTPSDPQGRYVIRPKNREAGYKLIPTWLKLILLLSLAGLVYIPIASRNRQVKPSAAEPASRQMPDAVATRPADELVLGESHFDRETRTLKGIIENNSNATYKDVVVSYSLKDKKGGDLGAIGASVPQVAPHSKVPFRTDAMPREASNYDLRELTGTVVPVLPAGKS